MKLFIVVLGICLFLIGCVSLTCLHVTNIEEPPYDSGLNKTIYSKIGCK